MFLLLNTVQLGLIVGVFVVAFTICQNSLGGTQGSWFSELFATNTRSSGAGLAYQASAVVSGFTAFWAVSLYEAFGWMGPAVLFSIYGAVGLIAALATPESFGPERRALVDRLTAEAEQGAATTAHAR
jgi:MHS family shikimate/dehydroshikimate transporter-like MFS transporter